MNFRIFLIAVGILALTFFSGSKVIAQSADPIRRTWNGPDSSLIMSLLKNRKTDPSKGTAKPRTEVVIFRPAGDSGVAKSLAAALGRDEGEKAALTEAFEQIRQSYEAEVAKAGKTQLVLQTSQETRRDGGFSANSDFPNSFLYSPGSKLEWRY